jgi:lysophospholipase L1-like esterase
MGGSSMSGSTGSSSGGSSMGGSAGSSSGGSSVGGSGGADVAPSDANIQYRGRWDKWDASTYHSYWGGAFFRIAFTGTTIAVKEATSVDFFADIDGNGYTLFTGAAGSVNVTPTPLPSGTHVMTVLPAWEGNELRFQGLTLSAGGATVSQGVPRPLLEFIGDSISCGLKTSKEEPLAYPWLVSERIRADHTQIAYSGITLVDGYHYTYAGSPQRGQSVQYFWMQEPNSPMPVSNWNFANYTPRAVIINLGSNDSNLSVPSATFESTYASFMQNIRAKFAGATILAMRPFGGFYAPQIQNAVNSRHSAGDQNVVYVDTTGWLSSADFADGLHPTEAGHRKAADLLAPILTPYVG